MAQLLLVDFGLAPPGTPVPLDFQTSEGLRVLLPSQSRVEVSGSRTGIRVDTNVTLIPPLPLQEAVIHAFAGAEAPSVRFIDPSGMLVGAVKPIKKPDNTVEARLSGLGPIGRIDLAFPSGEGTLYALAGLQSSSELLQRQDVAVDVLTVDESVCQAIVYAETGTIEVDDEKSLPALAKGRQFIAGVAYRRNGAGVAAPRYPTQDQLKQPFIKRAWDRCGVAAKDAKPDDVGTCKHFVIWYSDDDGKTPSKTPREIHDKWPYEQASKITGVWGPYTVNELGQSNIYIFKYCGVA